MWISQLILLLLLHDSLTCRAPRNKCDFVCDCEDCSDEFNCGYSGPGFVCDFEDEAQCGWSERSANPDEFGWERRQGGNRPLTPDGGPSSDFTTGTATGWFIGVRSVTPDTSGTAALVSPELRASAPTCRLRLRYFLWDSGSSGLGRCPLWASVLHEGGSSEAVVWRPEATSVRGWREDTLFLGRIPGAFRVQLSAQRVRGQGGDVALDQLEFLDCALPAVQECPAEMLRCRREGCVEQRLVCDGTDDCGDATDEDEETCAGHHVCDFEDGLCDWDLRTLSTLKWLRTSQRNLSITDPLTGPGRDHSNNTAAGHFLYVSVPEGGLKNDWASFQSPLLEPTSPTRPCRMVMYTHQFGPRSGGLTVLIADKSIYPLWERGGALGDLWVRAELEIVTSEPFQIVIMAAIRDFAYGGVAIDSIVLSPDCRTHNGSQSLVDFPKPPKDPCAEPPLICDFNPDCTNSEDESKCGDFSFPDGSSGWTDSSVGSQGWRLFRNSTSKEQYLFVADAPGQQLTPAQTRTPLLGPSGPACSLSLSFALSGDLDHIGELSVRVIDSVLGVQPTVWGFSGRTGGGGEEGWRKVTIAVGARRHRFQLVLEARAQEVSNSSKIKVQNVHFLNCHADYFPAAPSALSCSFEGGLCGWFQDNGDNFDWSVLNGSDHTLGIGQSLVVDVSSPDLRGLFGRLLSFIQSPGPSDSCLSFYYRLYGPNTGALNVKLLDGHGYETVLWTRSGAHGNVWHEGHCPVPHQLTRFQLSFEAVRSGFDGQIAIDDVVLLEHPCSVPWMCSFEQQQCGYSSSGSAHWLHRTGQTSTRTGPKTDHTLETELGFYMMVNTAADLLPSGSSSLLTSPVRQGTTKTHCLHFWYQMGGAYPGSLSVYMKPLVGQKVQIFSDRLDQGQVWRHGSGNISSDLKDWQLEFEVIGAGGENSFVAVDDIVISAHACQHQGSKCDLERGLCTWSNTQNRDLDSLDWDLTSAETERHYSTPQEDHTLGTEKGHFLFLPSTGRTPANQKALLLSPHLPPTKGTCLRFWAHIPSSSDSLLKVSTLSSGRLQERLLVREVPGLWRRFHVDITSSEEYQMVLEGIKGTSGVVAVDDIEYTIGINCANEVTDPQTSSQGDDTGGLVASVLVVLLLIGTLAGLLVFYLRTRQRAMVTAGASSSSPVGISNDLYEPDLTQQDHVTVPRAQNHPMAAGFNDITLHDDDKEVEVA